METGANVAVSHVVISVETGANVAVSHVVISGGGQDEDVEAGRSVAVSQAVVDADAGANVGESVVHSDVGVAITVADATVVQFVEIKVGETMTDSVHVGVAGCSHSVHCSPVTVKNFFSVVADTCEICVSLTEMSVACTVAASLPAIGAGKASVDVKRAAISSSLEYILIIEEWNDLCVFQKNILGSAFGLLYSGLHLCTAFSLASSPQSRICFFPFSFLCLPEISSTRASRRDQKC